MKVYFLLSKDVIFKPALLYSLILRVKAEIVGVGEVGFPQHKGNGKAGKTDGKKPEASATKFWGLKGMVCLGATIFWRKLNSALPFPQYLRSRSTIKRVCRLFGVPWSLVENVNDPRFLEELRRLEPDVIVSFQHQIFKRELLELPKKCCLNCHPAELPKYRGVKPIFWAMLNREERIGVTVHTMDPDIDCGSVVCQKTFPLLPDATLLDNYNMAYGLSAVVIAEALDLVEAGEETAGQGKIDNTTPYWGPPSEEDLDKFLKLGLKIV